MHAAFPKTGFGGIQYTTLASTRDNVAHLAVCLAPGMNRVRAHYKTEKRLALMVAKQTLLAHARHSRTPGAGKSQRNFLHVALKDMPISLSQVIKQENAWARAVASAGLPLHAVDNPELKLYIDLISQGRSKLPDRKALSTTILDRVAGNVDVSMAAIFKTVIGGTPR